MTLSTHVLDTSVGRPAAGMHVRLSRYLSANDWEEVASGMTGADGRIAAFDADDGRGLTVGRYRLVFAVATYFASRAADTFYTDVSVEFVVRDEGHYHVPLLVSPYGYSTYRGS